MLHFNIFGRPLMACAAAVVCLVHAGAAGDLRITIDQSSVIIDDDGVLAIPIIIENEGADAATIAMNFPSDFRLQIDKEKQRLSDGQSFYPTSFGSSKLAITIKPLARATFVIPVFARYDGLGNHALLFQQAGTYAVHVELRIADQVLLSDTIEKSYVGIKPNSFWSSKPVRDLHDEDRKSLFLLLNYIGGEDTGKIMGSLMNDVLLSLVGVERLPGSNLRAMASHKLMAYDFWKCIEPPSRSSRTIGSKSEIISERRRYYRHYVQLANASLERAARWELVAEELNLYTAHLEAIYGDRQAGLRSFALLAEEGKLEWVRRRSSDMASGWRRQAKRTD